MVSLSMKVRLDEDTNNSHLGYQVIRGASYVWDSSNFQISQHKKNVWFEVRVFTINCAWEER